MSAYSDGYRQALEDVARDLECGEPGWAERYRGWVAMIRTGIIQPECAVAGSNR